MIVRFSFFSLTCLSLFSLCAEETKEICPEKKQHQRVRLRHIESGGVGYNRGYTTVETFFAKEPNIWKTTPFLDLRGHVFNDGTLAANVGIGTRTLFEGRVWGINSYYDYRQTNRFHSNQIGIGLETLGEIVDVRINGYLPVGKKTSAPYRTRFDHFSGHEMFVSQKYQFAMKGLDAELGGHFAKSKHFDFFAGAGPYVYRGYIGSTTWGGKVRIAGKYNEMISLELSDSYDNTFHNHVQGQISFNFPFGQRKPVKKPASIPTCKLASTLTDRMLQPVNRSEIIVIDHKRKESVAIDPATGLPYFFVFVDNTSHSQGTFESPYPTLLEAQINSSPNDVIYVFPGDGTTTGMDAGIILQSSQKFWGSGVTQQLQTEQGTVFIPAMSSSSPRMTNTAGSGITLSTNNEISGFMITSTFDNGIYGINPENVKISSSSIVDSELDQIHLEYATSFGNITLNNLTLTGGLSNHVVISAATIDPLTLSVTECLMETTAVRPFEVTIANAADISLTNNQFLNNTGSVLFDLSGPSKIVVSDNTFQGHTSVSDKPFQILGTENQISATFTNNLFNQNETGSIHLTLNACKEVELVLNNNQFTNNHTGSVGIFGSNVLVYTDNTTVDSCTIRATDNLFSNNTANALFIPPPGTISNLTVTALRNTMSDNTGAGIAIGCSGDTLTLIAENNTLSYLTDNGIGIVDSTPIQRMNITLSNNSISHLQNNSNGIALSKPSSEMNLTIQNNTIDACEGSGILSYSDGNDTVTLNISGNVITNCQNLGSNASSGIDFEQYRMFVGTMANNTLSNNANPAVVLQAGLSTPNTCLTLTGNSSDSEYALVNLFDGVFHLSPCNVDSVNTGTISLFGTITHVQSCPTATPCPP